MSEEWRPVPGWPEYLVSSLGRVRGKRGQLMRLSPNDRGYLQADLSRTVDGKRERYVPRVNRLVLLVFVGSPPAGKPDGAHLNGNRADNRLVNLKWVSKAENSAHKVLHGTVARTAGEAHGCAVLREEDVREIRTRLSAGERHRDIADAFGVSRPTITAINTGRKWRHVA